MKIESHFEKIERFDALRKRLDYFEDFEIWFWTTMNAGTNAVNAALHATGITEEGPWYPQQPGVYMVADDEPGTFVPAFKPLGDVLHVGRPKIEKPIPEKVQRIADLMDVIEEWRDPCVRDGEPVTQEIVDTVDAAYREAVALAREVAAEAAGS
ncbi:MAG: hypothetical protein OXC14_13525 [Rhodospirillaceae bacterium]|nr:hypothetical protein [Rhodospirillaceae bacterium]